MGRVALVTGAGSGIGRGVALALGAEGWDVAVLGRTPATIEATAYAIRDAGSDRRALAVRADVRDPDQVTAAVAEVERELGPIDALINNAGVQRLSPALELRAADWDDVLDTNLKAAFLCAQAVGRPMTARGSGAIVNVASTAAFVAVPDRVAYAASKAGLVMLTKALALEWAAYGVRVNAVAPTFVDTELGRATLDQPGQRDRIVGRIPMGRLAEVGDVVGAIRFLLDPGSAGFVTGHVLTVDGGLSL